MKHIVQEYYLQRLLQDITMETIPELRITFDVSHWCNVSESLLQDQQETVDMALQRVDHIHARIGHPGRPAGK